MDNTSIPVDKIMLTGNIDMLMLYADGEHTDWLPLIDKIKPKHLFGTIADMSAALSTRSFESICVAVHEKTIADVQTFLEGPHTHIGFEFFEPTDPSNLFDIIIRRNVVKKIRLSGALTTEPTILIEKCESLRSLQFQLSQVMNVDRLIKAFHKNDRLERVNVLAGWNPSTNKVIMELASGKIQQLALTHAQLSDEALRKIIDSEHIKRVYFEKVECNETLLEELKACKEYSLLNELSF